MHPFGLTSGGDASSVTSGWPFTPTNVGDITGASSGSVYFTVSSQTVVTGTFSASDGIRTVSSPPINVNVYPDIASVTVDNQGVCKTDGDGGPSIPNKILSLNTPPTGGIGSYACTWSVVGKGLIITQDCGLPYDPSTTSSS